MKKWGVKRYGLVFITLLGISLWVLPHYLILGLNASSSLSQHSFLIVKGLSPRRGDYIAFYPPPNPLYDAHHLFVKRVAGIEGDNVIAKGRCFYVNDFFIGCAKRYSSKGLLLKKGPVGTIPAGYYCVYAPHVNSFDSRYGEMGWINKKSSIGRAYPLF